MIAFQLVFVFSVNMFISPMNLSSYLKIIETYTRLSIEFYDHQQERWHQQYL